MGQVDGAAVLKLAQPVDCGWHGSCLPRGICYTDDTALMRTYKLPEAQRYTAVSVIATTMSASG